MTKDISKYLGVPSDLTCVTHGDAVLARSLHVAYLQVQLTASEPDVNDIRVKQIADFGGKETMELLE